MSKRIVRQMQARVHCTTTGSK